VRISTVSAPLFPRSPDSPSRKLYGLGGLVVGAVIGMGLALLVELREKRRVREAGTQPSGRRRAEADDAVSTRRWDVHEASDWEMDKAWTVRPHHAP
jgi:hypothetical protein